MLRSFDDLWKEMVKVQPRLNEGSESVVFSVPAFRRLSQWIYDNGRADALGAGIVSFGDVMKGDK